MNYTNADPAYHLHYWTERIRRLLMQSLRDRRLVPAEQALDVYFDRFLADQTGTVERIYDHAGLRMTPAAKDQMRAYLEANARTRQATVQFDLRADFGADPNPIRTEFEFYFDRVGVAVEVR